MRVCLLTGSFPRMDCGVGDYAWQLARHLTGCVQMTVLTSDRPAVREFLQSPSDPVTGGRSSVVAQALQVRPIVRDWSVRALPALRRAVLASRPDVLHIQYAASAFDLGAAVNLLARWLKLGGHCIPVVTTLHDPGGPRLFWKAGPLRRALVRYLCRHSDLLCCPDRPVRDWAAVNSPGKPIVQVPVGVNVIPDIIRPLRDSDRIRVAARERLRSDRPELFKGGPLLVTFGNLHPDKDYESVFAALRHLSRRPLPDQGADWSRAQWVLVGGSGRGADTRRARELGELASAHGLAHRTHFAGYCAPEAVSEWMTAADLCVLPLPQGATDARASLLVALAHGAPTVVVGPGLISEHLRDGEHLRCVPPGAPEALADLLDALMRDVPARRSLGQAGCTVVEQRYRWSRIAAETVAIYRKVAAGKRAEA